MWIPNGRAAAARFMTSPPLPAVRRLSKLLGTRTPHETLHAGAQVYVNFLSLTRRSGWLQGHISKQSAVAPAKADAARKALLTSASRHLAFTELRKLNPKAVPTRDISVVWSADLLRPQLGKIIGHEETEAAATAWFDHQQHRLLQSGALFERATGRHWNITRALTAAAVGGAVGGFTFKHPIAAGVGAAVGAATAGLTDIETGAKSTSALRRFDADASGSVSVRERKSALMEWQNE